MHVWKKIGIAAGLTAAAAVSIAVASPANADTAAQNGDAVGVGSDTLQNAADFVFDGAPGVAGGFNTFAASARVDNVFATGDANGRAVYDGTCGPVGATGIGTLCSATNAGAPNSLIGSVILRAGTKPVLRPNGSGQGVAALIADSATPGYDGLPVDSIQFARMSRLPSSTEEQSCDSNTSGCGALRVFQAATDNLGIARLKSGFDGPAGLSAQELLSIYTCQTTTWNQLPGNSAGSTDTIHPLIPQSGSGTRNFFLQDLAQDNNLTTAVTPGTCVRTVQEHDPTGIYADPKPADAIEPFSQGKIALINSGYFANGVAYAGSGADSADTAGAYTPGLLTLESGTPGDSNKNYLSTRGLYFTVRQTDTTSTTPFEPGSTLNFVQALFTDPNSSIRSAAGQAEISAAGFTPDYKDCGPDPTTC